MTGVGRYTYNLLAALDGQAGVRLRALVLPEVLPLLKQYGGFQRVEWVAAPVGPEAHPRAELFLWRGVRALMRQGELYHGPAFIAPLGRQPFARVVTVHDLFVFSTPQFYPLGFRCWLRWMSREACRRAQRIIVPTREVARELAAFRLAPPERVVVIPEAPDQTPAAFDRTANETALQGALTEPGPLLVTIGTLDPRKDPVTARRACVLLAEKLGRPTRWLWLGGAGASPDPSPPDLVATAARAGFMAVGPASSAGIQAALGRATAYVTCSRAEGFGLPLVEAFLRGCPVVASDIPVHREVCDMAAVWFPPGEAERLAEVLANLLQSPEKLAQGQAAASARAGFFSWERAALDTINCYVDACQIPVRS
jgi:glycosyltransferase involved in cell wall biosynthesis